MKNNFPKQRKRNIGFCFLKTLEEINNLGRLHHSYIRDNDGNIAFILINDLSSTNSSDARMNVCPPNLKWISMAKFFETIKENELLINNSCFQQITDKLPVKQTNFSEKLNNDKTVFVLICKGYDRILSRINASTRCRSLRSLSQNAEQCRLCSCDGQSVHAGLVALHKNPIDCQCFEVIETKIVERDKFVLMIQRGMGMVA